MNHLTDREYEHVLNWLQDPKSNVLDVGLVAKIVRQLVSEKSRALDLYASRDTIAAAAVREKRELEEIIERATHNIDAHNEKLTDMIRQVTNLNDQLAVAVEVSEARDAALQQALKDIKELEDDKAVLQGQLDAHRMKK